MKPLAANSRRVVGAKPLRTPRAVGVSLHSVANAGNNVNARAAMPVQSAVPLATQSYAGGKLKPGACTNCKHATRPIHAHIDDNHAVDAGNYRHV